ncbi:uncharacterized protein DNG_02747 [Cephalotrichum gorgonifer]|uniref:Uncharacterized protein n=1 Tax=Cephalotrichum gorgonifer TaxID=2041049 RepID=A0AAE8STK1_9PEZI|nr:uncharacterized protein DNG_02747 [Cephalotrichum gorgonifer]
MPLFHSPATPSELLSYLVSCQSYPTTLIVCCPREPFQDALAHHVASVLASGSNSSGEDSPASTPQRHKRAVEALLAAPLYQTAIAKHIRILFVPTVSHLRAYLSVFDPADSKVPPPPNHVPATDSSRTPLLMVYGLLDTHRDTSEWNAQGLSCTVSILVEAAARATYKPVIIEPRGDDGHPNLDTLLSEAVPLLGPNVANQGVWSGRTVSIGRILGRWFRSRDGPLGEGGRLDQT